MTSPPDSYAADADGDGAAKNPSQRRERLRPLVLGMSLGLLATIAAVIGVALWTRDTGPRLTWAAYDAAVERWEKNAPADYDLDVEQSGNRSGKIHVEVRGGEVTRMTYNGIEPEQKRTWYYWSVLGQFDTIGQELEMARDPGAAFHDSSASHMVMWTEFDPEFGYPKKYDRAVLGADFEVHWRVTRFNPLGGQK